MFPESAAIETLAQKFAQQLITKNSVDVDAQNIQAVHVDSLENQRVRRIGSEYIGVKFFKKLQLDKCLQRCGFNKRQIEIAMLLLVGCLVEPGSERHRHHWSQHLSGLDELIGCDFNQLSLNSLYKVMDLLQEHKAEIEAHLRVRETDLFSLEETIILYDLTNTYFEGHAAANSKAKFGRSKEKRSDCRLLTLGLVIDSQGFPKTSQVFAGNQSEPQTLLDMVKVLHQKDPTDNQKPTVVIDAGLATTENLKALKEHYHYIAVSRKKIEVPESADAGVVLKATQTNTVEARRIGGENEIFLYFQSHLKKEKEQSMQGRLRQNF